MRLPGFDYLKPQNLDEILDLLAQHKDDSKILAGGTDLLVRMKKGLLAPKYIISLKALDSLSYIKDEPDCIKIGSRTPIADIIASRTIQNTPAHCSRRVKQLELYLSSIMQELLAAISSRITDATTTTSQTLTVPAIRHVIKPVEKSAMQERRLTDAIPHASPMEPQL